MSSSATVEREITTDIGEMCARAEEVRSGDQIRVSEAFGVED